MTLKDFQELDKWLISHPKHLADWPGCLDPWGNLVELLEWKIEKGCIPYLYYREISSGRIDAHCTSYFNPLTESAREMLTMANIDKRLCQVKEAARYSRNFEKTLSMLIGEGVKILERARRLVKGKK